MGFCLGVANIIPGVSGGTFLLVFGIYEQVFSILNQINKPFLMRLAALVLALVKNVGKKGTARDLIRFLRESGFLFLFKLAAGAFFAIIALSSLMKYLLLDHFSMTYALFFGLILVSIIIPIKMLKCFNASIFCFVLLGALLTVFVAGSVNPYDKIKMKSDHLARAYAQAGGEHESVRASSSAFTHGYGLNEYLYIGICGALAISATVLPGISGSLVLILMGAYFEVISAISALKTLNPETYLFLGVFGLGVLLGGLLFARLVSFVLSRYYKRTMAFLTGLMIGSLYALWPFKQSIVMARQYVREQGEIKVMENVLVQTNINVLPGTEDPLILPVLCFIIGCLVMAGFVRAEAA
ncbi:MAG: DUF368 domain-containing protein [Desulfobacter sp.]|nr:DUF368 domain-containing protein [Desulfobacter sp.]WDP87975.1 MAG: DUF368 domain-containing protein [Desulfobacter sp.]